MVDRLVIKEGLETRLADSLRTSLDLADGIAILETLVENGEPLRHTFSENFACPVSGFTIPEIEPRLFSFNAPFGACPDCDGLGAELFFDERLVVPDKELKISDGALAPWRKGKVLTFCKLLKRSPITMALNLVLNGKKYQYLYSKYFYMVPERRKSYLGTMRAAEYIR